MALVDQLAASLGDLSVGEGAAQRPAAAADAARRLMHFSEKAGVAERVGGAESGEAGADDDDLRLGGSARGRGEPAESGEPERGDAGLFDEAAPRRRPFSCGRCRRLHCTRQGSAGHAADDARFS